MYQRLSLSIIAFILLLTIGSVFYIQKLKFNYDFESYFPTEAPELEYLKEYRKKFENDTDFIIVGIVNKKGVFNKAFLSKIDSLTYEISKLNDVRKIISPTTVKLPIISSAGIFEIPIIHSGGYEKLKSDSAMIYKNPNLVGNIFSADGNSVNILIKNTLDIKKKEGDNLLDSTELLIQKYHFDEVHVAGKIKASKVYIDKMKAEVVVFISASTILISLFLLMAYRSAWGVVVPLLTVIISITWTLAIMGMLGKDIDLLTSLLPPILFVVAMSDMTHLLSKYLEELRFGHEKIDALKVALKEVGVATFITAATTSIGFVTLLNSTIRPIRDFGFYTSIGVFGAYFLAFSFLPAVLVLIKKPKISHKSNEDVFWHKGLQKTLLWIFRNKKAILYSSIIIIFSSLFFINRIEVNSTLLEDLSDRDPLKKSVVYFEDNFGGVRPFEMGLALKDKNKTVFDYDVLFELNKIESYLQKEYKVNNISSPLSFVKMLNQAMNGGLPEFYKLPGREDYPKILKRLQQFKKREEIKSFITKDGKEFRINGKVKDVGSKYVALKNKAFNEFMSTNNNSSLLNYNLTGSALLIDNNNMYLAKSLIEDLIIGILSIAFIIGLLFRSVRMVILALIPNLIPLMVIGGIMGMFGITLKASTSIIFSIAFGIAVDDSIHFLSRFKLELSEGKPLLYALKRTYLSTGKAMVVTSLILISGFATLVLSSFQGTFYTGLLISLTLLVAIIADLLLLPVLLILFYKKTSEK